MQQVLDITGRLLPEVGVNCLMVGGHAVNYYGVTRATQDVDFLIAGSDTEKVQGLMMEKGFSNCSMHTNVIFFNRPGSPLRVDYLVTNENTLSEMMERSVVVNTESGGAVRLPCLEDLLGMKLFSLHTGGAKRRSKDLPDIVALVKEYDVNVDTVLKELCLKFADAELFNELKKQLPEQGDA